MMNKSKTSEMAKNLGKRIADKRIQAGLTQEYVAESLNIGNEAVSRIERGVAIPNAIRLLELAEILNCRTDELLHGSSYRLLDQMDYLGHLLEGLNKEDRILSINILEQLTNRLRRS